jgi:HEAT repeat protein
MATIAALLSLALVSQAPVSRPQDAPAFTTRLAGREVKFDFTPTPARSLPEEVLNWDGWKFLEGATRVSPEAITVVTAADDMQSRYQAAKAKQTVDTPVWRHKIFVITRGERMLGGDGFYYYWRETIEDEDLNKILQEIAKSGAYIETALDGKVRVQLDVEVDTYPRHLDRGRGLLPDSEWWLAYLRPRLNGPGFVPDDKTYRGPYDSFSVIHPFDGNYVAKPMEIGGAPGWITTWPAGKALDVAPDFGVTLANEWFANSLRVPESWSLTREAGNGQKLYAEVVAAVAGPDELSSEDLSAFLSGTTAPKPPFSETGAAVVGNVTLDLANDAERGQVLRYKEAGWVRSGLFYAPLMSQTSGKVVQFWAKTTSKDPVSIYMLGSDSKGVVLAPLKDLPVETYALPADGKWHQINAWFPSDIKSGDLTAIGFGAPSDRRAKFATAPVEVLFDDFEVIDDDPNAKPDAPEARPNMDSESAYERALGLQALTADSPATELDKAIKLLTDPTDLVRINAAAVFTRAKYAAAEPGLIGKAMDPNVFVGVYALKALHNQGTPTAQAAIRRILDIAPDDARRGVAIELLTESKDPKLAGPVSTSIIRASRDSKLAAIKALGEMEGEQPALILTAFLSQEDPWTRLTAVQYSDISYPAVRRQILYTAVNDTSDLIRATAYKKLLAAADAPTRAEGAKGARDEGLNTRLEVVEAMGANPTEEWRNALRTAVVDSSAQVRAAAIRAIAKLPNGVKVEEIENTLGDKHPWVQLALLDIAENNGFKLPESTLKEMEQSSFPGIAPRAAKLPRN